MVVSLRWLGAFVALPRRWHQGRELLHQLPRFEDDVARAVAPAVLQAIEEPPVLETREPVILGYPDVPRR
jgi:hypothetical protein